MITAARISIALSIGLILAIIFVALKSDASPNLTCTNGYMIVANDGQSSCGAGAPEMAASAAQCARMQTNAAGLVTWTYPVAYAGGIVPVVIPIGEGPSPWANVIVNVQLEGAQTNTSAVIRVTKTTATLIGLLSLTLPVLVASPGVTYVNVCAKAP